MSSAIQHRYSHTLSPKLLQSISGSCGVLGLLLGSAASGPCGLPSAKRLNSDYEGSIAGRILHVPTATNGIRNFYRDSVALMQLSSPLGKLPGIS